MRLRWVVLLLLTLAGIGLLGVWRLDVARDAQRQEGVEASQIRGWARSQGGAGPSVLPKRVPAVDERSLRRVQTLPGFHEYAMRCSSCHVLPDPAAYPADRWVGRVDVMRGHIERAGVVPPPESELDSVRAFLRAASDTLRGDG